MFWLNIFSFCRKGYSCLLFIMRSTFPLGIGVFVVNCEAKSNYGPSKWKNEFLNYSYMFVKDYLKADRRFCLLRNHRIIYIPSERYISAETIFMFYTNAVFYTCFWKGKEGYKRVLKYFASLHISSKAYLSLFILVPRMIAQFKICRTKRSEIVLS